MSNEVELVSVIGLNFMLLMAILLLYYLFFVRKGVRIAECETFTNFIPLMRQNFKMIMAFDQEYYENFCGQSLHKPRVDGYQYLYFLRSLFKVQFLLLIIGFVSIYFLPQKSGLLIIDQEFTPQFQFYMTLINCIILVLFAYHIKNQLGSYEEQTEKSLVRRHSFIVQGIKLNANIEDIIQYYNTLFKEQVKVLNVTTIPKFPIEETKIQKENELYLSNKNELALKFFNPTLHEIPPAEPSCGHAIVTINNSTMVQVQTYATQSTLFCCYNPEVDDQLRIDDFGLRLYEAPDQVDFFYLNLNTPFQQMIYRRILTQIALILILLFFTTPASVIELIGFNKNHINQNEDYALIKQYISLTLLITLNSGLLKVIEYSCRLEQPISKSQYQMNLFSRSVFYLTINMFIIPAISFLAVNNLYQIIMEGANNLISAIQAAYFLLNGKFFIGIILQAGFVSFISLIRLDEIFTNHLSVFYTTLKRQHYKFNPYLQPLEDMFTFGYYYSVQIAILYIIMTFGTNVPIIYLSGMFFSGCRLFADSLSLLSVFGQEIKSNNNLILKVLQSMLFTAYPKLIINFIMFGLQWNLTYSFLTMIQFLIYTLCAIKLNMIYNEDIDLRIEQVKDYKIYDHPF